VTVGVRLGRGVRVMVAVARRVAVTVGVAVVGEVIVPPHPLVAIARANHTAIRRCTIRHLPTAPVSMGPPLNTVAARLATGGAFGRK
jgi:hypothetical protein